MKPLPIDDVLPQLLASLRATNAAVLEAAPGAGKTTRVPGALLDSGILGPGQIIVLQPRRLATRLAAQRVAFERGERVGDSVGYQIRFDEVAGPKTKILFVTEGILTRRLMADPALANVSAVVLDEFHERHLTGDLALALLRRLQKSSRPDLKVVVMSATLDGTALSTWLDGAPLIRSEGRAFPIEYEHQETPDDRHLEQRVLGALKRLCAKGLDGHCLVFLPGAGEIRRCQTTLTDFARAQDIEVFALHGDMSAEDQDRALGTSKRRKVILSTNVAETSVTIDGVAAVIDSGLARVARQSPWSGLPELVVAKVSRASAIQRAGRAGRTRAGVCIRLYAKSDFDNRPFSDAPEIRRADLADTVLALRSLGVRQLSDVDFFEAPPAAALTAAEVLLRRLGAIDAEGSLTVLGAQLVKMPVHPRLGRIMLASQERGIGDAGAAVCALLSEKDLRSEQRAQFGKDGKRGAHAVSGHSDVTALYERYEHARALGARAAGADAQAFAAVERTHRQLRRFVGNASDAQLEGDERDKRLGLSVLAAYPDRVAKRRKENSPEIVFAAGGAATLDESSEVRNANLLVAVDAEERRGGVFVRLAQAIEPEWLLELFPDAIRDEDARLFNIDTERVERVSRLLYEGLALEETRRPAIADEACAQALAAAAVTVGVERFVDSAGLATWKGRLETLRGAMPELALPAFDAGWLQQALSHACQGATSFAELRQQPLLDSLTGALTREQHAALARHVPERIVLPSGRGLSVNYPLGQPPWVESRLQDFFGMSKSPTLCAGRVSLVLHLNAPNHRAVQVTTDLAGFWERHYPAVRKELMRKYPRHAWPDNPLIASPSEPRRR